MKCLAVIPARAGSKRIPRKNLRSLLGRPLISYTIEAAQRSGRFDRIIVSTDDPEIAALAHSLGVEAPFLRPAALADDVTPVSAATRDALLRVDPEGSQFDRIAQLMATCPLRTAEDIVASHEQFEASSAISQLSTIRFGWQNPWWAMKRGDRFELEPLFPDALKQRSQDLPPLFCPSGAVWWATTEALRRQGTFHVPERTGWEIPWERGVDIDEEQDWLMAEVLLSMGMRDR